MRAYVRERVSPCHIMPYMSIRGGKKKFQKPRPMQAGQDRKSQQEPYICADVGGMKGGVSEATPCMGAGKADVSETMSNVHGTRPTCHILANVGGARGARKLAL